MKQLRQNARYTPTNSCSSILNTSGWRHALCRRRCWAHLLIYTSWVQVYQETPDLTRPEGKGDQTGLLAHLWYTDHLGPIIKSLVKLQCSTPCISSYNMKATMCPQYCKSGSSKIYKFIVGRLYVLLRRAHCSQHMATYNMEQPIRECVTNYNKSLFVVFHS